MHTCKGLLFSTVTLHCSEFGLGFGGGGWLVGLFFFLTRQKVEITGEGRFSNA